MLTDESSRGRGILYIDDEEKSLKYFRLAFGQKFDIYIAPSGPAGMEVLRENADKIGIVISDQRMPDMLGAEVLENVRNRYPHIVRILATAYSDLDDAIQAVNRGHIYQYVVKPWEVPELEMVLRRAVDYHHVMTERDELLGLKMSTLQRVLCSDRLKWLLLATRGWAEDEQVAFRRVLLALIRQLPGRLNPEQTATSRTSSVRDFDIGSLVAGEFANATACLDDLDALRGGTDSWAERAEVAVASLAEALGLEGFQTAVAQAGTGWEIAVSGEVPARSDLVLRLGGVLAEKKSSAVARRTLVALQAAAMAGRGLAVVMPGGDDAGRVEFATDATDAPSATDVIDGLHEQFTRADIAGLPERKN